MEIKKEGKFKRFLKKFGALSLAGVFALAIALTIAFTVPSGVEEVTTNVMNFGLPMTNAVVLKDYAEDRLQRVEGVRKYEIHLSVDLTSENSSVFSIYDGVVKSIDVGRVEGTTITIEHQDGFVSVYASLDPSVSVAEGAKVSKGQEIGKASNS